MVVATDTLDMKVNNLEIHLMETPSYTFNGDGIFAVNNQHTVVEFSYTANFNLLKYLNRFPEQATRLCIIAGAARTWGSAGYLFKNHQLTPQTVHLSYLHEHPVHD